MIPQNMRNINILMGGAIYEGKNTILLKMYLLPQFLGTFKFQENVPKDTPQAITKAMHFQL